MKKVTPAAYWSKQPPITQSMFRKTSETLFREEKKEIQTYLRNLKAPALLDLASGIGRFTRFFSERCDRVISVDFTRHFVEKNKQDHPDCHNVEFICANALDLQIPEKSLDFVFLNWLCIYLNDDEVSLLIEKIYTWLKAGGQLFLRESCNLVRTNSKAKGYFAIYRTIREYDLILKNRFNIIYDDHLKSYVYEYANPFQCYWHCQK
jgi:SAM-dependent methyltransferase